VELSHDRLLKLIAALNAAADGVEVEQRGEARVGVRASVLVAPLEEGGRMGGTYSVKLSDLSSEGVSFRHHRGLPRGSQFVLDLPEATDEPATVRVLCRVIHARSAGAQQFTIGAQFVRLWTAAAPELDAARAA
jgi:hypothetical protein